MDSYQQTSEGAIEEIKYGAIHHNLSDLMPASSEVGHLWAAYLAENMSVCILKKWVNESTDPEIHLLLQEVLDMSSQRVQMMENLFHSINYPIPSGFGEKDVDVNSPKLFSETFSCLYTRMMQKMIMHHFVGAVTSSYRSDFRDFYSNCLKSSEALHKRATEILLAKGILQKHPNIVTPHSAESVSGKEYFGSYFKVFGDKRMLNASEIGQIYSMMELKQLSRTLNLGFCQVVKSPTIRDYLLKAIRIADKQLNVLGDLLTEQEIPRPSLSEILITDSRESGFSDRLVLSHSSAVAAYIATGYGLATPDMLRKDLTATLLRFMSEILGLAKDGAELMVEAGWLERIPETADRKKLTH